jgi:hypothetical protein
MSIEANNDEVICPACTHQFRAIPCNVQKLLLAAGYEPPFLTPPAGAQEAPAGQPVPYGWMSLKDAAEEFIRRVEAGEILSKHSYQRFTQALQEIAANSEERK